MPEFVEPGLWLRTQSARAVPVRPAHAALGALLLRSVGAGAPADVDGDVVADMPAADACPIAAAATIDVATTNVFNFQTFIKPPKQQSKTAHLNEVEN